MEEDKEEEKIDTATQEKSNKNKKKEVYLGNEELKKDEELIFDNSAYEMLHRANVQWPCLSVDVLCNDRFDKDNYSKWFPENLRKIDPQLFKEGDEDDMEEDEMTEEEVKKEITHLPTKYPFDSYVIAGSQADKDKLNCVYVMKWTNLYKTLHEDEEGDDNDEDAMLYYDQVPHLGQVNRVRSMHGSNIVATWGHLKGKGKVSIFNLDDALKRVEKKHKNKSNTMSKSKNQ